MGKLPHYPSEEIKSQRGEIHFQKSHSSLVSESRLELVCLDFRGRLFTLSIHNAGNQYLEKVGPPKFVCIFGVVGDRPCCGKFSCATLLYPGAESDCCWKTFYLFTIGHSCFYHTLMPQKEKGKNYPSIFLPFWPRAFQPYVFLPSCFGKLTSVTPDQSSRASIRLRLLAFI